MTPTIRRRTKKIATFVLAFAVGVWVCDRWMTVPVAAADDAHATTRPATTRAAATRPALPPEVATIAQRVQAAYAQRPVVVKGTLSTDFAVAGMVDQSTRAITGALESPTHFRHEANGELVVVADGSSLRVLDVASNAYVKKPIDADATAAPLGEDEQAVLAQQDPALLVAITGDATAVFAPTPGAQFKVLPSSGGAETVEVTSVDGVVMTVMIEVSRGTIRQVTWDFAKLLRDQGAVDVQHATATLRYDQTDLGGALPADALAFNLPPGAREAQAGGTDELLADVGAGGDPSNALTGHAAPAVELADLDGASVKAAGEGANEGQVVVLDFWATWCPPCRAGLPHLAEVAQRFKDRGVQVYAVNQREDADTVRRFLADQHLTLTALLDSDGEAGKRYRVRGIPQTVVIDRSGKVSKVIVGFSPASANQLDEAVENALK